MNREKLAGEDLRPVLILLAVSFLLGGVAGCLMNGANSSAETVEAFLTSAAHRAPSPSLWRELWVLLRWPAAALVVGILPMPGAVMPILFFLRGYLLSYGISAFVLLRGAAGWVSSGALFGPICVLAVPVFFLAGTEGLLRKVAKSKTSVWSFVLSVPALLICAVLDTRVTPPLLSVLLHTVSGS